ncbi:MAG: hypothetical protein SNI45_03940 [Rikenellaceae bacterium]
MKKLKTAMTLIIAIQSAIEIAKFVGDSYKSYKIARATSKGEGAKSTPPTNDEVR